MVRVKSAIAAAVMSLLAAPGVLQYRAFAQGSEDPLAKVPKLLQVLDRDGFQAQQGQFRILDPIHFACVAKIIPSAWYNNVQPYMTVLLPKDWETTTRVLPIAYFLRQDEALLIVGSTPPPMAYFSFQNFLLARYNPKTLDYPKPTGGFFAPYELLFSYLGDTVNSLMIRTTGSNPYNRPMVLLATGNRRTQERMQAALLAAGYPAALINTETLPASLVRFGYDNGDQFLFLMRMALPAGGASVIDDFEKQVQAGTVMQVFRVRPKVEFSPDPLPAPVLRPRGTGQTEMDLYPTMERLRQAILDQYRTGYTARELDTTLPVPEGYPAIQRDIAWNGPVQEGSAGYGRDANYLGSDWFDLPQDGFAIVYGVDHAATGKATYSSASVYIDQTLAVGIQTVDSATFAAFPGTASSFLPTDPSARKFYVWKVARICNGNPYCMEAKPPSQCVSMSPDAPVRVAFRAYAEPATKTGPTDVELIFDRVIVFEPRR